MLKLKLELAGVRLLLMAALSLAVTGAQAQQRSTGGTTGGRSATTGNRSAFGGSTGGRSSGGPSSSREYPNNTMVGDATITSDPESRKIIVVTDEDTNLQIADIIKTLDKPKPQVLIKVVFLEITHSDEMDIGLEGSWQKNYGNQFISGLTTNFGVISNAIVPTSITPGSKRSLGTASNIFGLGQTGANPLPPGAGLYQVLGKDYQVTLRAIAQAGNAEVLSRPSILARNSQPATITVGQSVPLITNVRFDTFGNAINSVSYTDVGVILKVTPFISSDNMVEMILAPELSSISATDTAPISAGVQAPVIDKRSADTVVVTPDGQTVIVGGLMGRQKTKAVSKIPLLGDIPYVGALFKRTTTSDIKTELMIFLTPHIVAAPSQLSALGTSELNKMPMTPSQLTEDDLNRFLENLPVKKKSDAKPAPIKPKK